MGSINGQLVQALAPVTSQVLSISGTTASSTTLTKKFARLVASVDCFIAFGEEATTSKMFLPAGEPEYFSLAGVSYIAAITSAATGSLYLSEMN